MNSFLKGVRRTDNLSTNRTIRALTLVAQQPVADTPAAGMPVLPGSARAEAVEDSRQTAPLPAVPVQLTPFGSSTALEVNRAYRDTATLRHVPVAGPGQTASMIPLPSQVTDGAREMAQQGINAVFKALPWATGQRAISQIERRDRVVFLLLDGRRSIQHIAQLIHRDELDIARTIVRLLKRGYIEPVGTIL
ncbi:MAG TPA: hypothetical protein VKV40_01660 [Ktedonobacteraceae bacterium]|nr:hypothetical protein [Ktedonobacteraceae bacterium]